jgi:hypothetical protein
MSAMTALKIWSPRSSGDVVLGTRWPSMVRAAAQRMAAWPAGRSADPARLEASRDAAAVRELAYQYMQSDPGFAADLFAAADRHEANLIGKPLPDDSRRQPCKPF